MGVDLFDALGGSVQLEDTDLISHPIGVVTSPPSPSISMSLVSLAEYPSQTSGFGRLKGFVHRPHIVIIIIIFFALGTLLLLLLLLLYEHL